MLDSIPADIKHLYYAHHAPAYDMNTAALANCTMQAYTGRYLGLYHPIQYSVPERSDVRVTKTET